MTGSVDQPDWHSAPVLCFDEVAPIPAVGAITPASAGRQVPGLKPYRTKFGLNQDDLARLVGLARETISRIEAGRPAGLSTIRSLAAALRLMPSVLTGTADADPVDQPARRCIECKVLRPIQAFVRIQGTTGHYGRCRVCRNARARARSWSSPEIVSAARERVRRIKRKRTSVPATP